MKYITYNSQNVFLHISIYIQVPITISILLSFIIKSICILIPPFLYYLIYLNLMIDLNLVRATRVELQEIPQRIR